MYLKSMKQASREKTGKIRKRLSQVWRSGRAKMGMGTLEVVIIIGALLTLALFFSTEIKGFAGKISDKAFQETRILAELEKDVGP